MSTGDQAHGSTDIQTLPFATSKRSTVPLHFFPPRARLAIEYWRAAFSHSSSPAFIQPISDILDDIIYPELGYISAPNFRRLHNIGSGDGRHYHSATSAVLTDGKAVRALRMIRSEKRRQRRQGCSVSSDWWKQLGLSSERSVAQEVGVSMCRIWVGVETADTEEVQDALVALEAALSPADRDPALPAAHRNKAVGEVVSDTNVLCYAIRRDLLQRQYDGSNSDSTSRSAVISLLAQVCSATGGAWRAVRDSAVLRSHEPLETLGFALAQEDIASWRKSEAEATDDDCGMTPLHWAALGGSQAVCDTVRRLHASHARASEAPGDNVSGDGAEQAQQMDGSGDSIVHAAIVGAMVRATAAHPPTSLSRRRRAAARYNAVEAAAAGLEAVRWAAVTTSRLEARRASPPSTHPTASLVQWWYGGVLFSRNARGWTCLHEAAAAPGGDGARGGNGDSRGLLAAAAVEMVIAAADAAYSRNAGAELRDDDDGGAARHDGAPPGTPVEMRWSPHDACETRGGARLAEVADCVGHTALHVAARVGHGAIVDQLVALLLGVGYLDVLWWKDGARCDACFYAARNGHTRVVSRLLQWRKLSPPIGDGDHPLRSSLQAAIGAGHAEVATCLASHMSDWLDRTAPGTIPIHVTAANAATAATLALRHRAFAPSWDALSPSTAAAVAAFYAHVGAPVPLRGRAAVAVAADDGEALATLFARGADGDGGDGVVGAACFAAGVDITDVLASLRLAVAHARPRATAALAWVLTSSFPKADGHVALAIHDPSRTCEWLPRPPSRHPYGPLLDGMLGRHAAPRPREAPADPTTCAHLATWRAAMGALGARLHVVTLLCAVRDAALLGMTDLARFIYDATAPRCQRERLTLAAAGGLSDVCEALIAEGLSPDAVADPDLAGSPLVAAASGGHVATIRLLTAHGAVADAAALEAAVEAGSFAACCALVEAGALRGGRAGAARRAPILVASAYSRELFEYLRAAMVASPAPVGPCRYRDGCSLLLGFCTAHMQDAFVTDPYSYRVVVGAIPWQRVTTLLVDGMTCPHGWVRALGTAPGALLWAVQQHAGGVGTLTIAPWVRAAILAGLPTASTQFSFDRVCESLPSLAFFYAQNASSSRRVEYISTAMMRKQTALVEAMLECPPSRPHPTELSLR